MTFSETTESRLERYKLVQRAIKASRDVRYNRMTWAEVVQAWDKAAAEEE